jgi:cation transporter-like permease
MAAFIYPTMRRIFRMAWFQPNYAKSRVLFFLVASIGGALVGGVLGVVISGVMGAPGVPTDRIVLICKILGFFVSMPISFFTSRWSVRTYVVDQLPQRLPAPPSL